MNGTEVISVKLTASTISNPDGPGIVDAVQEVIEKAGGSITSAESFARDQAVMVHEFDVSVPLKSAGGGSLMSQALEHGCALAREIEDQIPVAVRAALQRSNLHNKSRIEAIVSAKLPDGRPYTVLTWSLIAPNEDGKAAEINRVLSHQSLAIKTQSIRTHKSIGIVNVQTLWLLVGDTESTWRHFAIQKMDEVTHRLRAIQGVVVKDTALAICRGSTNVPLNGRLKDSASFDDGELMRIPYNGDQTAIQDRFAYLELDTGP
jgi:hypothetical protein